MPPAELWLKELFPDAAAVPVARAPPAEPKAPRVESDAALVEEFLAGSPRALARAISRSESGRGAAVLRAVYARTVQLPL